MTLPPNVFSCPGCGQQFKWRPELAGRKLSCSCGQLLKVPDLDQPAIESYELSGEESPPARHAIDVVGNEVKPVPVLSYSRIPPHRQTDPPLLASSRFRDFHLPIGTIVVSALVLLLITASVVRLGLWAPHRILADLSLRLGWDIVVTISAGAVLARIIDVHLGLLPVAILKLGAIAVARSTIWAMFGVTVGNVLGDFAGFLVSLPVFAWLLSYLFELDVRDTMLGVTFITLVRWISYFGLWKLL